MNPVRTLGPAIAANNYKSNWLYRYNVGPVMGMVAGATAVRLKDEDATPGQLLDRTFRR